MFNKSKNAPVEITPEYFKDQCEKFIGSEFALNGTSSGSWEYFEFSRYWYRIVLLIMRYFSKGKYMFKKFTTETKIVDSISGKNYNWFAMFMGVDNRSARMGLFSRLGTDCEILIAKDDDVMDVHVGRWFGNKFCGVVSTFKPTETQWKLFYEDPSYTNVKEKQVKTLEPAV